VDLPLPGQREVNSEWGDDLLDLEGAMIFVVQLLRWSARFDVASIEYYQVSHLVCWGFLSVWVGITSHSLLCIFQPLSGFIMHGVYPMSVYFAGQVQGAYCCRVYGHWVEAIVSVEWGHTVSCCGRIVVGEFSPWQQVYPVVLFSANKGPEVGLNCLIEPFCLSIHLEVENC